MMTPTENSHFRKYLSTLGVSIVVASVSLAGLFFRLQAELLVEQSVLQRLTPQARRALELRQTYLVATTFALPYLVGFLILLGIVMAVFGLRGWASRQKIADNREEIERDKIRAELRQMSESDRAKDLDAEAKVVAPDVESGDSLSEGSTESVSEAKSEVRFRIRGAESAVYARLREVFGRTRLETEVRLGRSDGVQRQADAVVQPWTAFDAPEGLRGPAPGFVFEVKYFAATRSVESRLVDAAVQTAGFAQDASQVYKAKVIGCVVAVVEDAVDIDDKVFRALNKNLSRTVMGLVRIVPVKLSQIPAWDPIESLRDLIED